MSNLFRFLGVLVVCGAPLFAQSAASGTETAAKIVQTVTATAADPDTANAKPDASQPAILNIMTVIGNNVLGLPCLDCLLNFLIPDLALPSPVSKALLGKAYQIDSFLIDNSYTGSCTFTLSLSVGHNVIATATQTIDETAGTNILITAPITLPTNAVIGLGTVSNTAVCGSNTTESKSPVTVACVNNPPFCLD